MDTLRISSVLLVVFLVAACAGGADTFEEESAVLVQKADKDVHNPVGHPIPLTDGMDLDVAARQGYVRAFSPEWKVPAWVAYRLDRRYFQPGAPKFDRLSRFLPDPELEGDLRITQNHYAGTGLERAQMAPPSAMQGRTEDVVRESYYMSNVAPQYASLEGRLWMNLEGQVRKWVRTYGRVYVITGPIFAESIDGRLVPAEVKDWMTPAKPGLDTKVALPTHFYKIVYRKSEDGMHGLAFVVPNQAERFDDDWNYGRWQVTIDEVEDLTGFDFLSRLENEVERELESGREPLWE